MKKAWEEAEPGRAAKALQSRLNYLKTHMIKVCDRTFLIVAVIFKKVEFTTNEENTIH